ncbi:MAG: type II secretion system F family protein [Candidatus Saccharibacteria bacterium]|nr:type II secretion system F family protein [Candidatus Saccharibacteria bacterium]
MKTFTYTARDNTTGSVVNSIIQADSERSAASILLSQELSPLSITEQNKGSILDKITNRIRGKDKVFFTRQLSTLVEAGLPITQSLHTILDQTKNKRMQEVIQDIITSVEGGKTLHDAVAKHPDVFNNIYIALVRAGETSGTLDRSLKRLADQQEKDEAMMRRIRGAMYYPSIVLLVIVMVLVFMLVTIIPQIEQLYAGLNKPLPLATAALVWMANAVKYYWYLIIAGVFFVVYFFRQYMRTETGIKMSSNLKLNAPVISRLFRKMYMARFTRTADTLLEAGVPMLDMLDVAADAVDNVYIANSINVAAERVKGGMALSKAISDQEYFNELVPQMIKIGEQSGRISQMLGKVASVYEDELDEEIKAISTIIEPALMVFMAIMAGGIVMAVLMPIYSLVGTSGTSIAK